MEKGVNIGVIGGGLMGMSIALELKNQGYKVSILESAKELGGLAVSWQIGKYVWDKFYHVILPDDSFTISLLNEIGLKSEICWEETKTGFFIKGQYYSMSNVSEFLKFPVLNLIDKFRLGLTILAGSYLKDYKRLEKIPVSVWLIRWSGRRTFENIWQPLLKAKLGDDYKSSSAAFICATIKRLYGARKNSSKKEVFGYVRGGYSLILNSLIEKITSEGISVENNFRVKSVSKRNDELIVSSNSNVNKSFDYIISTLPSALISKTVSDLLQEEKNSLEQIKYLGVLCISVLLKKQLTPYYVTNITDSKIPFTGVIEMTSLVDKNYFEGKSLLYLPKYLNSENEMFDWNDEKIKEYFINSLKKMQPELSDEEIIEVQVAKARHVITLPTMDYSLNLPNFTTSLKSLFIINSSFITDGTLNINETLRVARTYLPKVINEIRNETKSYS